MKVVTDGDSFQERRTFGQSMLTLGASWNVSDIMLAGQTRFKVKPSK
jgi:hypothetical protein